MLAILDGEILNNTEVFVDSILEDAAVKDDRRPLVVDLITLAIGDGTLILYCINKL